VGIFGRNFFGKGMISENIFSEVFFSLHLELISGSIFEVN